MTIKILPPDEAAKKAREKVAEWKRQKEIDAAKAKIEAKKAKPEPCKIRTKPKLSPEEQKELNDKLRQVVILPGATKLIQKLIAEGADVNTKTSHNETVLLIAAWSCATENVKMLIDLGADVNTRDDTGRTALTMTGMCGRTEGRTEIIDLLKKHGATE